MKRVVWIDWAKALLIVFMIIGHYASPDALRTFIYTFHMPAFFIISGYLYKPKSFGKVLLSFAVPLIIWGFIHTCFVYFINIQKGADNAFSINQILYIPMMCPGSWFIITLMLCRMISGDVLGKWVKERVWGGQFCH